MTAVKIDDYPRTSFLTDDILVIDDDSALREVLTDILSLHTEAAVITAANGHEGIKILRRRQNIALILLDMNMPVMNGEETYERVQQIAPAIPVIVSSSLSPSEASFRFGRQKLPAFLQKPYDIGALLDVVHSASTGSPSHPRPYDDQLFLSNTEKYHERRTEQ